MIDSPYKLLLENIIIIIISLIILIPFVNYFTIKYEYNLPIHHSIAFCFRMDLLTSIYIIVMIVILYYIFRDDKT